MNVNGLTEAQVFELVCLKQRLEMLFALSLRKLLEQIADPAGSGKLAAALDTPPKDDSIEESAAHTVELLFQGDFTKPLVTMEELRNFVRNQVSERTSEQPEMAPVASEAMLVLIPDTQQADYERDYENFWKHLNALWDLGQSLNLSTGELPVTLETYFAAVRRCSEKKIFIEKFRGVIAAFFSEEKWMEMSLQVVRTMARGMQLPDAELAEIERDMKAELGPELEQTVSTMRQQATEALVVQVDMFWEPTSAPLAN